MNVCSDSWFIIAIQCTGWLILMRHEGSYLSYWHCSKVIARGQKKHHSSGGGRNWIDWPKLNSLPTTTTVLQMGICSPSHAVLVLPLLHPHQVLCRVLDPTMVSCLMDRIPRISLPIHLLLTLCSYFIVRVRSPEKEDSLSSLVHSQPVSRV